MRTKKFALSFIFLIVIIVLVININTIKSVFHSKDYKNEMILIDAGHGGDDPGAVVDGVRESDINLKIALKLKEYFDAYGIHTVLTRYNEKGLYNNGHRKIDDLKNRKKMIKDHMPLIFISIHLNSFPISKYWGAQVFYEKDNIEGKILAELIQEEMRFLTQERNNRLPKPIDVYILKGITIPSVLIECGFMSNPNELYMLQQDDYQTKLANSIFLGCLKYFKQKEEKDNGYERN